MESAEIADQGNGSGNGKPAKFNGTRALWVAVLLQSGLLVAMITWGGSTLLQTGERWRQMDVNTQNIRDIQEHGSPGIRDEVAALKDRMRRLEMQMDMLQQDLYQRK